MNHEFVNVDGVSINATHLLSFKTEDAVAEILLNDQVPGKNKAEKTKWAQEALGKAKKEVKAREEKREKDAIDEKKRIEAAKQAEENDAVINADDDDEKAITPPPPPANNQPK